MQGAEVERNPAPQEQPVPKREIVKPRLIVKIEIPALNERDGLFAPQMTAHGSLVFKIPPASLYK